MKRNDDAVDATIFAYKTLIKGYEKMQKKWYLKLIETLKGKKTYIVATVAAVLNLLAAFGVITFEQIRAIDAVLVALGLAALRDGMK